MFASSSTNNNRLSLLFLTLVPCEIDYIDVYTCREMLDSMLIHKSWGLS